MRMPLGARAGGPGGNPPQGACLEAPARPFCTGSRPHPARFSQSLAPSLGTAAWHPIAGEKRRRRQSLHTQCEPQASSLLIKPLPDKTQTLAGECGSEGGSRSVGSCRRPGCLASGPGPPPAPTLGGRPLENGGRGGGEGRGPCPEQRSQQLQGPRGLLFPDSFSERRCGIPTPHPRGMSLSLSMCGLELGPGRQRQLRPEVAWNSLPSPGAGLAEQPRDRTGPHCWHPLPACLPGPSGPSFAPSGGAWRPDSTS